MEEPERFIRYSFRRLGKSDRKSDRKLFGEQSCTAAIWARFPIKSILGRMEETEWHSDDYRQNYQNYRHREIYLGDLQKFVELLPILDHR